MSILYFILILKEIGRVHIRSLQRDLANNKHKPVVLACGGVFFGHPILLIILELMEKIQMPKAPTFYLGWLGLTAIALLANALIVMGLTKTKFFFAQTLYQLTFIITGIYAIFLLGEKISFIQWIATILAATGIILLTWPKKIEKKLQWDKGILITLISMLVVPFGNILYKFCSTQTTNYSEFLTGRLVMDLVYYGIMFAGISFFYHKKNPLSPLSDLFHKERGKEFLILGTVVSLVHSFLVFKMPISQVVLIETIAVPAAYFFGKHKYEETHCWRAFTAAGLIVGGIILFTLNA